MPKIKAFCGLRYNTKKIKDLARVYAPPYDIISPNQQKELYRKSPYNFVRLELGLKKREDSRKVNQYTRASDFMRRWQKEAIWIRDSKPCLYIYVQHYREGAVKLSRLGFLAAMRIDEKEVFRHEKTLAKPKRDRLGLLKEVKANLSPIFGLIEDPSGKIQTMIRKTVARKKPDVDVSIDGVRHQVIAESSPEIVEVLAARIRCLPMHIADGHHRFDVACQFKRLMGKRYPNRSAASWHYVLTYFSDVLHNPFSIYPTHRLIRTPYAASIRRLLTKTGQVKRMTSLDSTLRQLKQCRDQLKAKRYDFGFYTKKDGFMILTLDQKKSRILHNNPVERLDVAVLHNNIIEPLFNIRAAHRSDRIDFTRSAEEAAEKVNRGSYDLAVFLRPTSLKEMMLVSKRGLRMPQKSTYFYPKLLSGLVVHSLDQT